MCRVGDLKVWVTMMLNFRLKGYVSRQYRWTIRMGMVYYNLAPGRLYTKICRRHSIEIEFYFQNPLLGHPFGNLGVTYTLHL